MAASCRVCRQGSDIVITYLECAARVNKAAYVEIGGRGEEGQDRNQCFESRSSKLEAPMSLHKHKQQKRLRLKTGSQKSSKSICCDHKECAPCAAARPSSNPFRPAFQSALRLAPSHTLVHKSKERDRRRRYAHGVDEARGEV